MRFRLRLLLLAIVLGVMAALSLAGCNVVQWRAQGIAADMRAADLVMRDTTVGEATIHYWADASFSEGAAHSPAAASAHALDERPVALLIHGFGASAMWQWHQQVAPLAATHRLVVPDLLWFGESTSTRRDFTLDYQVRVVLSLLDRLGASKVDVVGISYGGLVAYELASQHPERVSRLVVVDSPGRVYTQQDYAAMCERFGVAHIADVLIPRDNADVTRLLELAYYDPPWTPDWARTQVRETLYADYAIEKRALLDSLIDNLDELRSRPDPRAPTMLMWGEQDPVFPLPIAKRLQRHLSSDTQLRVIPLARHAPNLEHPERFNELLLPFLRR